jgi:hypothetical protein
MHKTIAYNLLNLIHVIIFIISCTQISMLQSNIIHNDTSCGNIFEWAIATGIVSLVGVIIFLYDVLFSGSCNDLINLIVYCECCDCDSREYKNVNIYKYNHLRTLGFISNFICVLWGFITRWGLFDDTCQTKYENEYFKLKHYFFTAIIVYYFVYSILGIIFLMKLSNDYNNRQEIIQIKEEIKQEKINEKLACVRLVGEDINEYKKRYAEYEKINVKRRQEAEILVKIEKIKKDTITKTIDDLQLLIKKENVITKEDIENGKQDAYNTFNLAVNKELIKDKSPPVQVVIQEKIPNPPAYNPNN